MKTTRIDISEVLQRLRGGEHIDTNIRTLNIKEEMQRTSAEIDRLQSDAYTLGVWLDYLTEHHIRDKEIAKRDKEIAENNRIIAELTAKNK